MAGRRVKKASEPPCRVIKPGEVPAQKAIEWYPQGLIDLTNSSEAPTPSSMTSEVPPESASPETRRKKAQTQRIAVSRISQNLGLMRARIKFEAAEDMVKEAEKYRNLRMADMYRELDQLLGNLNMLNLETGSGMESSAQQPPKRSLSPAGSDEQYATKGRGAARN